MPAATPSCRFDLLRKRIHQNIGLLSTYFCSFRDQCACGVCRAPTVPLFQTLPDSLSCFTLALDHNVHDINNNDVYVDAFHGTSGPEPLRSIITSQHLLHPGQITHEGIGIAEQPRHLRDGRFLLEPLPAIALCGQPKYALRSRSHAIDALRELEAASKLLFLMKKLEPLMTEPNVPWLMAQFDQQLALLPQRDDPFDPCPDCKLPRLVTCLGNILTEGASSQDATLAALRQELMFDKHDFARIGQLWLPLHQACLHIMCTVAQRDENNDETLMHRMQKIWKCTMEVLNQVVTYGRDSVSKRTPAEIATGALLFSPSKHVFTSPSLFYAREYSSKQVDKSLMLAYKVVVQVRQRRSSIMVTRSTLKGSSLPGDPQLDPAVPNDELEWMTNWEYPAVVPVALIVMAEPL